MKDNVGHRSRLRERFARGGFTALAEYEIVELLLTFAIPRKDVKPIAKALIAKYKNLKTILNTAPSELEKFEGMGESSAVFIKFIKDIIPLYHLQALEENILSLDSVDELIKFFRANIESENYEVIEMICLDSELRLIPNSLIRVGEGIAGRADSRTRRFIAHAIRLGADSIVIAHNHPQGDKRPSADDVIFTRKLSDACMAVGISFLEHIIIAKKEYFSFRRDGRLDDLYDISVKRETYEEYFEDLDGLSEEPEIRDAVNVAAPRKFLQI